MSSPSIVNVNPLVKFSEIIPKIPDWCCKHTCVEIINYEKQIYRCLKCNKDGKTIKKFYQYDLVDALQKKL
jgi:hypothetical protein